MEAVAAVGVAAATVQFLDFGIKALVLCKQIRDKGSTEANQKLEHHAEELKKIYNELQQGVNLPAANRQITRTRQECVSVGDELLKLLNDVKINSRSKNLAAIKATFLAMKGKREIEKIQNKLEDSQKRFLAAVSVEVLNSVARLLEEQGKSNDTIRDVLVPEIRKGRAESTKHHLKTQKDVSDLKSLSSTAHHKTQSQLRGIQQSQQASQKVTDSMQTALSRNHLAIRKGVTELNDSSFVAHDTTHSQLRDIHQDQQSSQTATTSMHTSLSKDLVKFGTGIGEQLSGAEVTAKRKEVMESLRYPEMFNRQQTIKPPSIGTFEWIFDDSPPKEDPKQNERERSRDDMRGKFARWLRSDESLFWISGKAGSGKSSLMAFIQDDSRTKAAMSTWAGGHELYTFSFYFWRPGSALQKSIPGLLRSLLHQLANAKPAVIDLITSVKSATYNDWTTKSLLAALQKLLTGFREDRIFLMIDGLDEYEDQYAELLDIVLECQNQSHVKTCLASRPETAILIKLKIVPTLRLQDLNKRDISKFVWDRLRPYEDALTEELISQLIDRAEGVFLWAVLMAKSMISGCLAGDGVATLLSRLNTTPTELIALFEQLLSSVEKVHQESLCLCLFHLKYNEVAWSGDWTELIRSIGLLTASLPECQEVNSPDAFISACARTSGRLVAQWKGLVEIEIIAITRVHERAARTWHDHRIVFVHRSAYDFFFSPGGSDVQSRIPWLLQNSDTGNMVRMTLNGILVLLRRAPVFQRNRDSQGKEGPSDYLPNIHDCVRLAVYTAESSGLELTQNFFKWLDGLRTNFSDSFVLRMTFWVVVSQELGAYTESRWTILMEEFQARVICGEILAGLCDEVEYADDGILSLCRRLTEYLRKTHELPTATSVLHTRFVAARIGIHSEAKVVSWTTSKDDYEEALTIHRLGELYCNQDVTSDCMLETRALMLDWDVYCGIHLDSARPLEILVSVITRTTLTPTHRPTCSNDPELSSKPSTLYRILCLLPSATIPKKNGWIRINWEPVVIPVVGLLDLSTGTANKLTEFWYQRDLGGGYDYPYFKGTRADFRSCLGLLVKEIWANEGGLMTAWQQLYMLACVKNRFEWDYWETADWEASSAGGREESEDRVVSDEVSDGEDIVV
jgi:hypothetical protein